MAVGEALKLVKVGAEVHADKGEQAKKDKAREGKLAARLPARLVAPAHQLVQLAQAGAFLPARHRGVGETHFHAHFVEAVGAEIKVREQQLAVGSQLVELGQQVLPAPGLGGGQGHLGGHLGRHALLGHAVDKGPQIFGHYGDAPVGYLVVEVEQGILKQHVGLGRGQAVLALRPALEQVPAALVKVNQKLLIADAQLGQGFGEGRGHGGEAKALASNNRKRGSRTDAIPAGPITFGLMQTIASARLLDTAVFDLIAQEKTRQTHGLELIASENYVSEQVMAAQGSVLTNKYAEGLPGKRYYGGCEIVDQVEQLAIDRIKELFGVAWANVQPHSGAQANAAVMLACLNPGDKILGFDLSHGGHLTHGSAVNFSGKLYQPSFYGVEKETGLIDWSKIKDIARRERPKLIICGASAYSRDWDYKALREAADEVGALLLADISHPSALIATGLLNSPFEHCHIVTTTTHKTLRGPRGGLIMLGQDFDNPFGLKTPKGEIRAMSALLDSAVFPGTQGGPLEHVIAAKAVAFGEALHDDFKTYTQQVARNAQALAKAFVGLGYDIISGGTDNHLMLIDLRSKSLTGKLAENTLVRADITINKNMVPFDDKSPFVTSGIRIGSAAVTTRGLGETDMHRIVELIDEALMHHDNDTRIGQVRQQVNAWMQDYPLFA